jgi:hypothetical protein
MQFKRRVQAVTLISILVGIAVGAFIIVIMLQVFSTTRASLKQSENLAEMNNVLRFASLTMTNIISQAGFVTPSGGVLPGYSSVFTPFSGTLTGPTGSTYDSTPTNADDPAGVVLSYFPGESVILSTGGVDPEDKLWVKFTGDPTGVIRDCNDIYGVTGTAIRVKFYSQALTSGTGFYCERQDDGTSYTYSSTTPLGTELISPALFDSAWVRYGEDITSSGYIDRWSFGSDVQDRTRVYAVRVAFLIHSRDDVRNDPVTQTFYVFGQTVTRTSQKIYKLYMFTVMLPNSPNYAGASIVTNNPP